MLGLSTDPMLKAIVSSRLIVDGSALLDLGYYQATKNNN